MSELNFSVLAHTRAHRYQVAKDVVIVINIYIIILQSKFKHRIYKNLEILVIDSVKDTIIAFLYWRKPSLAVVDGLQVLLTQSRVLKMHINTIYIYIYVCVCVCVCV